VSGGNDREALFWVDRSVECLIWGSLLTCFHRLALPHFSLPPATSKLVPCCVRHVQPELGRGCLRSSLERRYCTPPYWKMLIPIHFPISLAICISPIVCILILSVIPEAVSISLFIWFGISDSLIRVLYRICHSRRNAYPPRLVLFLLFPLWLHPRSLISLQVPLRRSTFSRMMPSHDGIQRAGISTVTKT